MQPCTRHGRGVSQPLPSVRRRGSVAGRSAPGRLHEAAYGEDGTNRACLLANVAGGLRAPPTHDYPRLYVCILDRLTALPAVGFRQFFDVDRSCSMPQ